MNNRVPLTITDRSTVVPLSVQGDGAAVPVSVSADIAKDPYNGPYTVTPAEEGQVLETAGKTLAEDVAVQAVPSDYVGSEVPVRGSGDVAAVILDTALFQKNSAGAEAGYYPEAVTVDPAFPEATFSGSKFFEITDAGAAVMEFSPTQAGVVYRNKKYTLTDERAVPVRGAADIYIYGRDIQADPGYYPNAVIKPLPDSYYDMSGPYSWMGLEADLFDPAFYTWNGTLDDTAFPDWTASTTATAMRASENLPVKAIDLDAYDYWIKWSIDFTAAFLAGATLKAIPTRQVLTLWQNLHRHPSNLVNAQSGTDNYNYCTSSFTGSNIIEYYNTSGTKTIAWGTSYGFYAALTAATFSSTSSTTPNLTRKTPVLNARCSSTYFATARAAEIDTAKSTWKVRGDMYRVKKTTSAVQRFYRTAIDLYNNPL